MARGSTAGSRGTGESKRANRYLTEEARLQNRINELANLGRTMEVQLAQFDEQIADVQLARDRTAERLDAIDAEVDELKPKLEKLQRDNAAAADT